MALKFLFLEPFYGGSHRDFADGLVAHSKHQIDLLTLPDRFWKWRMRGAALYFFQKTFPLTDYDGLIVTDLMSLSDFKALCGSACPPALVYFHENQLTYPLAPGEERDLQFGFTDMTTALAAQRILFNSQTHLGVFLSAIPDFLKMMPDYRPQWILDTIRAKTGVLYPGCHFPAKISASADADDGPPLIIWNHRWEFDKNPDDFFDALDAMQGRGLDFRLALLGENCQKVPESFKIARRRFQDRIARYGYVESRKEYQEWLKRGAIVISTAEQENFGISVIEAMRFGCLPLLPRRLSYPEILPAAFHSDFLYQTQEELLDKLAFLLSNYSQFSDKRTALSESATRFAWENMIQYYDEELEKLGRMQG